MYSGLRFAWAHFFSNHVDLTPLTRIWGISNWKVPRGQFSFPRYRPKYEISCKNWKKNVCVYSARKRGSLADPNGPDAWKHLELLAMAKTWKNDDCKAGYTLIAKYAKMSAKCKKEKVNSGVFCATFFRFLQFTAFRIRVGICAKTQRISFLWH